jgi:amino acid transporter
MCARDSFPFQTILHCVALLFLLVNDVVLLSRAGLTGTYAFLYTYGGPVSAIWGWCLVVSFNFMIGLILSEICSAYPTSGGVYYWAHKLGSE